MGISRPSAGWGPSFRQRSTTASSSCPSLSTSAVTRTVSPAARFTGWRPQSICGCTFSMRMLPWRAGIRSLLTRGMRSNPKNAEPPRARQAFVVDPRPAGVRAGSRPARGTVARMLAAASGLVRRIGLFDATMIVMGGIVGSGIFVTPADVARSAGSPALILGAWVVGGVAALIGAGLFFGGTAPSSGAPGSATGFGAALIPVLFAYGGWQTACFVAGEMKDPRRDLPRALLLGVAGVIALYTLVAFVCLRTLGAEGLARTSAPALEVMTRTLGRRGALAIAAGVSVSTLGFLSQSILTAPRVYFAMAGDGLFFGAVARVHERTRAPIVAIALQGALAIAIALAGTFEAITLYVVSIDFVFLARAAGCVYFFPTRRAAGSSPARS